MTETLRFEAELKEIAGKVQLEEKVKCLALFMEAKVAK